MIEGKFEDLLNRKIDGETNERDDAELQEYLAQDQAARAYQEDLENLASMFERVHDVEPPPDLKDEIVHAARAASSAAAGAQKSADPGSPAGVSAILEALGRRLQMRSPYAFAAGLAVGALVFAVLAGSFTSLFRVDESVSPGALVPPEALAVYEPVDSQPLRLDGVHGQIATRVHGDRLLLELQLDSQQVVTVAVVPEAGSMVLVAFRQDDPAQGRVEIRDTEFTVEHQGANVYYVVLRSDSLRRGSLTVRARAGSQAIEVALRTQ